jgi:hypothetical protein
MFSAAPAQPSCVTPRLKSGLLAALFCAMVALLGMAGHADAQCSGGTTTTYNSSGGVAVTHSAITTSTNTITVGSLPAGTTITCVSVVLNGVTSNGSANSSMEYASFMLTAPSGQKLEFLGATGDGTDGDNLNDSQSGLLNAKITVADNAGTPAATYNNYWTPQNGTFVVRPGSYYITSGENNPPLPVGGNSSDWAASDGSATFTSAFTTGATPTGGWTLSLTDNNKGADGPDPVSVSSWSLVMTTVVTANVGTTTTLGSSLNPSFTSSPSNSVTLTATVSSTSTVGVGTVQFTDGGNTISCSGGNQTVSSGQATCVTTFSTEGIHALQANYSGGTGFNSSDSDGLNQLVENHTTGSGTGPYCNSGAITNNGEVTGPYPSIINVPSLGGSVADVSVTLNGLSASGASGLAENYAFLLVAPDDTHNLDFLDDAGTSGVALSPVDVTLADGHGTVPENGAILAATYEPTGYELSAPSFPASTAPAAGIPGTINYPQPDNVPSTTAKTLSQAFGGATATGAWSLFLYNTGGSSQPMGVTGGWCLNFTVNNGDATATTLASTENPASVGDAASLTATVVDTAHSDAPVTQGTVTFTENGVAPAGVSPNTVPLNGSGQASISLAGLPEGDHNITATYNGVNDTYDPGSASFWQREDNKSVATGIGSSASPAVYCNNGGFILPSPAASDNFGAANINPTNVFVTNMPGTFKSVEVELNGFHTTEPTIIDTAALLVGPDNRGFDFFSGTGASDTVLSTGYYDFADSASGQVPRVQYPANSIFQPTSYDSTDTFTPNASGKYTLPGTIDYAAPHSDPFTFNTDNGEGNGVFSDLTSPDGVWSLYFYQNIADTVAGATSWCVSLVDNLPTVAVTAGDNGPFTQGETGAQITVGIANQGPGSTGDPTTAHSNPIQVTDTLNSAFTYTGYSGTDWTCTTPPATTVTCTNDDSIADGQSYPALTLEVTVSATAGTPISNTASVTAGSGGVANAGSSTDSITVNPAPVLAVTKYPVGTFTQGSTAEWDVQVSNTGPSASSTSGTVTAIDTLPANYTLASSTGSAGWICNGTSTVTCTSTQVVAGGGGLFNLIKLSVNVPAASPVSVMNNVSVYGGGDLTHSAGDPATAFSTVSVVQVPAHVTITAGGVQSATVSTAFSPLVVMVTDAKSVAIPGTVVTFTAPGSGASGTFPGNATTYPVTTDAGGVASASFTANGTPGGPYPVTATAGSASASFMLTNTYLPVATSLSMTAPSTANLGGAFNVTVTVKDQEGIVDAGYMGTVTLTSTDPAATFSPASYTYTPGDAGQHTFAVTLNTVGSWTVTATDAANSLSVTSNPPIAVSVPSFVVTNTNDGGSGSLRQAMLDAATAGSGAITFDPSDFNTAKTINSASTLTVPANTTITGPTSGSGATLTNLVTVSGNVSSGGNYPVFTVNGGVTGASISGLIITNGSGGINNGGALTVTNCTITGNTAGNFGGGILSTGPITITGSTITNNTSVETGGGLSVQNSSATVINSTFTNNTSFKGGGIYDFRGSLNLKGVTSANNTATYATADVYDSGSPTFANSIVGDFNSNGLTDNGGNVIGKTGLSLTPLGNYGGPTQTMIPLPGSTGICSGTTANWTPIAVDQRGGTTSDPNCAAGAVDAGAVQSDYSLSVSKDASNVPVNTAMNPAPAIQLDENGSAFTLASGTVTIPLTLTGAGTLTGGSTSIDDTTGVATYSDLQIDTAAMSDKLTANLTLTSGIDPAVVLSVSTSSFEVMGGASSMTANSGSSGQSTTIGTAFSNPLAVTVLDSASDPVQGVTVTFTAPSTGASGKFAGNLLTATATTGANGVASTTFTANNIAGANYTVAASASGVSGVNFTLTNTAGAAASMTANAGSSGQSAAVTTLFTNPLAVTVEDASSNPVSGVSVTFTAPATGASGKFSNTTRTITVTTGSDGVASVPFTANTTAGGPYNVAVSSAGLTTVNLSLTNTAGAPSTMTANAGSSGQSATISTAFSNPLAVTILDASSNPVPNVNVTFTAPSTGASGTFTGSVTTITIKTDVNGVASEAFTANSTAGGPYNVAVSAAGLTTVNLSLTNTVGAPSTMTANAGSSGQSATISTLFANPLAVTIKDSGSNPVPNVNVTFTAPSTGASGTFTGNVTTITIKTDVNGVASEAFTSNATAGGPYNVAVSSAGLTTVNLSLTNNVGSPSTMTANAGSSGQSATISTAFTNPLAVTIKDSGSNPVPNVNVTFTAPSTGASATFTGNVITTTVKTDVNGIASVPASANSTAGGPYNVSAASAGLATVNFGLTNNVGAPSSMATNAGTTPQSALVNAAFANALAVTVKDSGSNPVPNVNVTFTAPVSGATGAFSNSSTTIVAATNANGIASASFTANGTPGGPYQVSAASAGLTTVNFNLTNTPAALTVTCPATTGGTVNVAFSSGAETVTGGVQPYTFYVGAGSVPNGLLLNTTNGAVAGTPLTSGSFSISVKDTANTVAVTSCPYAITAPALLITWPTPAAITYGTLLSATQLDASANASGGFSYNPAATTLLTAGSHQLAATFTPTDTKDYSVTTVHVTQVVNKATPVVSWSPAPLQIGSKLTSAQLDATANVPGKFVYTPALGTEITGSAETLKVVFTPTDSTDYNSVTQTVSLEVTVVSVSPLSLNFGTVYLDSITTKDVTVTNLGSVPVNVSTPLISILTDGDSREFVAVNLCLLPLQPHKSCTIQVSYVAGPFYRQQSAAMSVRFNSAGSPQTVSLTALTIDPETSLSATSLSFGTQKEGTSSASKTITLTNPGATALTIDSVTIGGSDPHDFLLANHCGSSLQAGSSCTFGITFKPGAKGSRSAKLTIQDNAKVGSQTVALSGAGD